MNMPELLVFVRIILIWFILAGVLRVSYYVGEKFAPILADVDCIAQARVAAISVSVSEPDNSQ